MLMNKKFQLCVALLAFVFLASCSLSTSLDANIEREVDAAATLKEASKAPATPATDDTIRVKNDIWLGDSSNIEYEGEPVPGYLEKDDAITLISNRPVTLYEIGDMINKVTSLKVRFAPTLEAEILSEAKSNKPDPKSINADWTEPTKMILSYRGSLSGLLEEISSRFGIWWKYEKKEIYFYKQITRTFVLYSLPSKSSLSATVGGNSSAGSGGSSAISLSNSAEIELWANIEKTLKSMLDKDSEIAIDSANGTITVTAKPNEIGRVSKYINEQNLRLSRQVAISVKVLQVSINDSDTYGLDLNAAFNDGTTKFGIASASGSVSSDLAQNLSMSVLGSGKWSGGAIIQALSKQGTTSLVTSGTVTTLNNKPAPIQVVKKQSYISEITKTNSGGTGDSYDTSTETEEIETGFTLDVLPRILEHNRLLMMFNLTLSDLLSLEKVYLEQATDPDKQGGQYIQNPIIESRGFSQEVALKSGETLVLTGFERVENTSNKTGVGSASNSLLGGSAAATKVRNILVIILTPVVLDSPLVPESRMKR